jgi:hypothetical protein
LLGQQFCRSDRVVRLWIETFNAAGIDALTNKGRPGRGRRVKKRKEARPLDPPGHSTGDANALTITIPSETDSLFTSLARFDTAF